MTLINPTAADPDANKYDIERERTEAHAAMRATLLGVPVPAPASAPASTISAPMTLDKATELCGDDHGPCFAEMFRAQGWGGYSSLDDYLESIDDPEMGGFDAWYTTLPHVWHGHRTRSADGVLAALDKLGTALSDGDSNSNEPAAQRIASVLSRLAGKILSDRASFGRDFGGGEDEDGDGEEEEDEDDGDEEEEEDDGEGEDSSYHVVDKDDVPCIETLRLRSKVEHLESALHWQRARNAAWLRAIGTFLDGHSLVPLYPAASAASAASDASASSDAEPAKAVSGLGKLFVDFCS